MPVQRFQIHVSIDYLALRSKTAGETATINCFDGDVLTEFHLATYVWAVIRKWAGELVDS
jgi:hypothetical protein